MSLITKNNKNMFRLQLTVKYNCEYFTVKCFKFHQNFAHDEQIPPLSRTAVLFVTEVRGGWSA